MSPFANAMTKKEELKRIQKKYEAKGKYKIFLMILKGLTGKDYKDIESISDDDLDIILNFFLTDKNKEF